MLDVSERTLGCNWKAEMVATSLFSIKHHRIPALSLHRHFRTREYNSMHTMTSVLMIWICSHTSSWKSTGKLQWASPQTPSPPKFRTTLHIWHLRQSLVTATKLGIKIYSRIHLELLPDRIHVVSSAPGMFSESLNTKGIYLRSSVRWDPHLNTCRIWSCDLSTVLILDLHFLDNSQFTRLVESVGF